jgi:hypothetical protein
MTLEKKATISCRSRGQPEAINPWPWEGQIKGAFRVENGTFEPMTADIAWKAKFCIHLVIPRHGPKEE